MEMYNSHGDSYERVVSSLRVAGSTQLKKSHRRSEASSGEALVPMPMSPSNKNHNEEWLIDDMPPTTRKKRKTSHDFVSVSRKRSCDATLDDGDFPNYNDDFLNYNDFPNYNDDLFNDNTYSLEECFDSDINAVSSVEAVVGSNQINCVRAMVKVEDHTFLVPCDPGSTVEWLCSVVAQRYAALDGRHPQLSLTNQKGALLGKEDLVAAVINNEECVSARVISWTTPPLADIYRNTSVGDVNNRVIQKLKIVTSLSHKIDLSNCAIRATQFRTILKCLAHQASLTTLCVCGNRFDFHILIMFSKYVDPTGYPAILMVCHLCPI